PDPAGRLDAVVRGDAHIATALDPSVLRDPPPGVRLVQQRNALSTSIMLNLRHDALRDKRVRQALNYAVDKQALIAEVFSGAAVPLSNPVGPDYFGHNAALEPYPFD